MGGGATAALLQGSGCGAGPLKNLWRPLVGPGPSLPSRPFLYLKPYVFHHIHFYTYSIIFGPSDVYFQAHPSPQPYDARLQHIVVCGWVASDGTHQQAKKKGGWGEKNIGAACIGTCRHITWRLWVALARFFFCFSFFDSASIALTLATRL